MSDNAGASPGTTTTDQPPAPWESAEAFPERPAGAEYGYATGPGRLKPCTREELVRRCSRDEVPGIQLVWTPDHPRLVPPEQVPFLFDAVKARAFRRARATAAVALLNSLMWGLLYLTTRAGGLAQARFLLLPLLMLGLLPLAQGLYILWKLRSLTPEAVARDAAASRYVAWVATRRVVLTWLMAGALVAVSLAQAAVGGERSVEAAGLVKQAVREGQVWRMATGTMLHGGVLHLVFNASALLALGRAVEVIAHQAHLAITFWAAAVCGSAFSLVLLPTQTSVGASGGVMGLIGFLAVLGARRRSVLPPGFLRSILFSIALISAIGVVAREMIDNAAHLGGLLAGLACGVMLVPRTNTGLPLRPTRAARTAGALCTAMLAATAAGSVWAVLRS